MSVHSVIPEVANAFWSMVKPLDLAEAATHPCYGRHDDRVPSGRPLAAAPAPGGSDVWTFHDDVVAARACRTNMENNAPTHTCGVCARLVSLFELCGPCTPRDVATNADPSLPIGVPMSALPNLELLRADIPPSEECPRDGFAATTYGAFTYCLHPEGMLPPATAVCGAHVRMC